MKKKGRKGVLIAALIWIFVLGILALIYKLLIHPHVQDSLTSSTGSESRYKQTVGIAADAFSGYAVLRSEAMSSLLRADGIKLVVEDDQADYVARIKALRDRDIQMAVYTIDALLTAGAEIGEFPASVVMVIDETVGADAMVGYKDGLPSLQALDDPEARIVATPSSPSEFLARTVIATLSLPSLPSMWLVEADGAGDVYKKFKAADARERKYAYVLWEPYVSKALEEKDAHVLLDSSKMKGYIVDVLVAEREFLRDHRDLVKKVVEAYSRAAFSYSQRPGGMVELVREDAKAGGEPLSQEEAKKLVDGIRWKNMLENYGHMGIVPAGGTGGVQHLEDIIPKIADVLVRTGALRSNPVEDAAHTLFFKGILVDLHSEGFHPGKKLAILEGIGPGTDDLSAARVDAELPPLSDEQWEKLTTVGAMRVESITFRRGTAKISALSESELSALARNFNSWPNYYMRIIGQARAEGNAAANRQLAQDRAEVTRAFLIEEGVAAHRLRAAVATPTRGAKSGTAFVLGQRPY
ncbi:MAG: OmpA family protein [Myxococcota bacterium]